MRLWVRRAWQNLCAMNSASIFLVGTFIAILLAVLDYLSGFEVSFAFFYLIPVVLVAWISGWRMGILISVLSTILWVASNTLAGQAYSNGWIPFWNGLTRLGFFLVVSFLLARIKWLLEHEKQISNTDFITGVANSRAFYSLVAAELERLRRYQHHFTLCFLDLDDFKGINDNLGHVIGDRVLRSVAQTIASHVRYMDVVARMGGDEFALLLPETEADAATVVLDKIHSLLQEEMQRNNWPVTASIGAITFYQAPESLEFVIHKADELMYQAKQSGKDRVVQAAYP